MDRFREKYGMGFRGLHAAYLKAMRRHKRFPNDGSFLPVFEEGKEEAIDGIRFIMKGDGCVVGEYYYGPMLDFESMGDAWEYFKNTVYYLVDDS